MELTSCSPELYTQVTILRACFIILINTRASKSLAYYYVVALAANIGFCGYMYSQFRAR